MGEEGCLFKIIKSGEALEQIFICDLSLEAAVKTLEHLQNGLFFLKTHQYVHEERP